MPEDSAVAEVSLRAIRVVQTQLASVLGDISTEEAVQLLALELDEAADELALISAIASVAAANVIIAAHATGLEPQEVIAQVRTMMTRTLDE